MRLPRKSPVSTGAYPPASFAILRVYASVTLSARPCAFMPAMLKSFITASSPFILVFKFTISHALSIRFCSVCRFLFYLRQVFRIQRRQTPLVLDRAPCRLNNQIGRASCRDREYHSSLDG